MVLSHSLQGNIYRKSSVKPPGGPAYLFQTHLRRGWGGGSLIEMGGGLRRVFFLFSLAKTVVSVLLKELEYKVEKLK